MSSSNISTASSPSTPPTSLSEDGILDALHDCNKEISQDFPSYFNQLPSSSRFDFWRPSYHLQAPQGWMNDPCAPGYNPFTRLYHVSFQWNPHGNDWGNISWLSATSSDMTHWTVDSNPTLSPELKYDCEGVFTGCMAEAKDKSMTYFYTSVTALPIHWTLPHPKGCEGLSMAISQDSGRSWTKSSCNPILPSEPEGYDVTGWRDPFVGQWPRMGSLLGLGEGALFGIVSGGIRSVTPTAFLYSIDADDLSKWKFISPLAAFDSQIAISRWSGHMGTNWECASFTCNLKDEIDPGWKQDFLIMGAEGFDIDDQVSTSDDSNLTRPCRNQLWAAVTPRKVCSGQPTLSFNYSGHLDYGCLYAANSFYDPHSQRQVVYGWITEDDLGDELRHAQGWSGMLSLPRELRMQTLQNVVGAWVSPLKSISSIEVEPNNHGSYTVRTLASQPCQAVVEALRRGTGVRRKHLQRRNLHEIEAASFAAEDMTSLQWELDCSFQVSKNCRSVGIRIQHHEGRSTTLLFSPQSETFTIHRPALQTSQSSAFMNSKPESAPHTLFTMRDPHAVQERVENLDIRAWRDNSVLEVFVNGRTAITTRLYGGYETCSVHFFADDSDECSEGVSSAATELLCATLLDGIGLNA